MLTRSALRLANKTAGCEGLLEWVFIIPAVEGFVQRLSDGCFTVIDIHSLR